MGLVLGLVEGGGEYRWFQDLDNEWPAQGWMEGNAHRRELTGVQTADRTVDIRKLFVAAC